MDNMDKYRELQKEEKPFIFESVVPALLAVTECRSQKKLEGLEGDGDYSDWRSDMGKETTGDKLPSRPITNDVIPYYPGRRNIDKTWILGVVLGVVFLLGLFWLFCMWRCKRWRSATNFETNYDWGQRAETSVLERDDIDESNDDEQKIIITDAVKGSIYLSNLCDYLDDSHIDKVSKSLEQAMASYTGVNNEGYVKIEIDKVEKLAKFTITEKYGITADMICEKLLEDGCEDWIKKKLKGIFDVEELENNIEIIIDNRIRLNKRGKRSLEIVSSSNQKIEVQKPRGLKIVSSRQKPSIVLKGILKEPPSNSAQVTPQVDKSTTSLPNQAN